MTSVDPSASTLASGARVCCLTVLRCSQLPQARVLAWSLERLHPDWHVIAALVDAPPPGLQLDPDRQLFDEILPAPEPDPAFVAPGSVHERTGNIVRTSERALASAIQHVLVGGSRKILVLDPGTAVLNSLASLADLLDRHAVVLVPHRIAGEGSCGPSHALASAAPDGGLLTPGCVAFHAGTEGARFAAAWRERLMEAHAGPSAGDAWAVQRWLDLVPKLFDSVHVLQDPGWNVSSRNLGQRTLAFDASGSLRANGHLLRTFDFSDLLARAGRLPGGSTPANLPAHDLLCWYRLALARFDDPAIPPAEHDGVSTALATRGLTATRYGPMRCYPGDDLISKFLRVYGEWAYFETLLLASMGCARVFDIGAYLGTFSLGLSDAGADFILAVEANPQSYALLRANLARNLPVPYATVHAAILQGGSTVSGAPSAAGNHGTFQVRAGYDAALGPEIHTRTLADLRAEFGGYDLLKLDVEGCEREVIRSDAHWIAEHKPVIWAECNEDPDSLALFTQLQDLGYAVFYYRFPAFHPGNFHGSTQRLVPLGFEAGLLAVRPGVLPECPPEAALAGAGLVRVETVEALRRALWLTPRHGDASWEGMSRTELLALLARQGEARTYDGFLAAGHAATPPAAAPETAPAPGRDVGASYRRQVSALLAAHDEKEGMSLAVGGQFEAIGQLEYFILLQHGLHDGATVIDVGCGSGRLAAQLKDRFAGRYVGIDVVPTLLAYAERICSRPDWSFSEAPGFSIPEPDDSADIICFFSVFTHLLHEESFTYLKDARRVCKPGGKIIFSFLEFRIPMHWPMFEHALADMRPDKVLNQFMSRDAVEAWVDHLGLEVVEICDGDKAYIDIPPDSAVVRHPGRRTALGQSLCVLTKPVPR